MGKKFSSNKLNLVFGQGVLLKALHSYMHNLRQWKQTASLFLFLIRQPIKFKKMGKLICQATVTFKASWLLSKNKKRNIAKSGL